MAKATSVQLQTALPMHWRGNANNIYRKNMVFGSTVSKQTHAGQILSAVYCGASNYVALAAQHADQSNALELVCDH